MALTGLMNPSLKLIMFGGKGGVGKTTCASCAGLYMAGRGMKTLIISTDPAHSLSDSLGMEIGSEIRDIDDIDNLSAIEIDAEKAFVKFKRQHEAEMKRLFDTGTYMDEEDIDSVLSLPMPGIDEVMGFKVVLDLIEEGEFDKYVVDTAPTGHAIRLLSLPGLLDEWIKALAEMRWKYRYMVKSFSGKYTPDMADEFLLDMKKTVKKFQGLLKNHERCEFIVVTIPEVMAVKETEGLIETLRKYGMNVSHLVINKVAAQECPICSSKKRWQEEYISRLKGEFSDLQISIVPSRFDEVKGIKALRSLGNMLFGLEQTVF